MNDISKFKFISVGYSILLLIIIGLLLLVVSWSGGVYNDIKGFDVVKKTSNTISKLRKELNSSAAFEFSKNKIVSGYQFSFGKIENAYQSIENRHFSDEPENDSTDDKHSTDTVRRSDKDNSVVSDSSGATPIPPVIDVVNLEQDPSTKERVKVTSDGKKKSKKDPSTSELDSKIKGVL